MKTQFLNEISEAVQPFKTRISSHYETVSGQKYFCVDVVVDESDLEFKEDMIDAISKVLKGWEDADKDEECYDRINIGIPVDESWERSDTPKNSKSCPAEVKVKSRRKDIGEVFICMAATGAVWFGGEVAKDYLSREKANRSILESIKCVGKNGKAWLRTALFSVAAGSIAIGVKVAQSN